MITANVCVFVKCRVYENWTTIAILGSVTLILLFHLFTFIDRLVRNTYSEDQWVWYRIMEDFANYLIGIISIILLVQWYQTYSVLKNLNEAMERIEKSWAISCQVALVVLVCILFVFDFIIIMIDHSSSEAEKSPFVHGCYVCLELVQAAIEFVILVSYMVLFISFLILVRSN